MYIVANRYSWKHGYIKKHTKWFANAIAMAGGLALVSSASAATTIAGFIQ
jgi:hypothetical protein